MDATLTWLDLTARDREKMRHVLDLFKEQGTIDEMGLGTLRDAFSESLFPGTSTIHTRLRYALFVPWIYKRLEVSAVASADVATRARAAELDLIGPLQSSDDHEGTIGARAGSSLARLPSSVYWVSLVRWGIFRHRQSLGWYHTHFARLASQPARGGATDDPGVVALHRPNWHPRMPDPPPQFPDGISFVLTRCEAVFLQGRIEECCAGTLLAWLAREGIDASSGRYFWMDRAAHNAPEKIRRTIELARRFSLHVEGMPLLYNLLLAERRHVEHGSDDDLIHKYRSDLAEWAAQEAKERAYDPNTLWQFAATTGTRSPEPQRRFVEHWSRRIAEITPAKVIEDPDLRGLIEFRERQLKGPRARLSNSGRLLDWSGAAGVGRMNFRWHQVRQLLTDLLRGLAA